MKIGTWQGLKVDIVISNDDDDDDDDDIIVIYNGKQSNLVHRVILVLQVQSHNYVTLVDNS